MPKKKKSQLKAPPRGFATTSVPKKITDVQDATSESPGKDEENKAQDMQPETAEPIPEKEDIQSLQKFVEKEIIRTLKAIEVDRRYTATLPTLEVQSPLIERLLAIASDNNSVELDMRRPEPEEKILPRLGITYGVLRRLGFSESTVNRCLRAIAGYDLDEAYCWLYTNCPLEELECIHTLTDVPNEPKTPITPKMTRTEVRTPQTPVTPGDLHLPPSHTEVGVPQDGPSLSIALAEDDHAEMKARILSTLEGDSPPESDSDFSEVEHPNVQYARLKVALDDVLTVSGVKRASNAQTLRGQMESLKKNLFFDQQEADALYRLERERSLRPPPHQSQVTRKRKQRPPNIDPQPPQIPISITDDIFSEDTDVGLFDILEPLSTLETSNKGTVIQIRDMSLPKHWSGRTPKLLLSDFISKSDRYAAASYSIVSGSSRAKRASVSIRWNSKKTQEWSMVDIACYDEGQAEQYIATVALHALTHSPTEGFASLSGGPSTSFRLLPGIYRDFWDELEETRKLRDETVNRDIWNNLKSILKEKHEFAAKMDNKAAKQVSESGFFRIPTSSSHISGPPAEQIASAFQSRIASSSYQDMLVHRRSLPIWQYRDEILQTLRHSQVLVLSGETGCGKSTQVPNFILEDMLLHGKSCKIYCTEPRRISAISLAQRVSRELGEPPNALGTNSLVGYQIRLASETSKNTCLTFVTNGIALRMLEGGTSSDGQGTAFDEVTHIIIDEVHERTIESDFLLIVLKSLLGQRADLKVILMSATVDADKIAQFFGGCPVLHVPGRTFPVEIQYLEDAVDYTGWTIDEDSPYARRQHDKFYNGKNRIDWSEDLTVGDDEDLDNAVDDVKLEKRYSSSTATTINLLDERLIPYDLIIRLLEKICFEDLSYAAFSAAILIFMPGLAEIRRLNDLVAEHPLFGTEDFRVYTLHSAITIENQGAVFEIPPSGVRKIVIATNICETGITIPDCVCVIDSGKHREMRFDEKRQISRLVETSVAKSNAAQRRGRAGRVQPGLCFHLFTKFRHDNQMVDHPLPEMLRLSLADLALRIKIMKIKLGSSIEDVLLRAMDPPSSVNIQRAISMLVEVRALTATEELTPLGRRLAAIPTDVHLGKFLLIATIFRCLDPALTIVATLNSKSPFVTPFGLEQEADRAKSSFRTDNSDFLTVHNAFSMWRRASVNPGSARKFCRTNFLSHQNLQQIEELRQQLLGYLIDSSFVHVDKSFVRELAKARYSRNRNRFVTVPPELDCNSSNHALLNAALAAGLYPKLLVVDPINGQMRTILNNQQVSFHPTSVNFGRKASDMGSQLAYFTLMHSKKLYAWETGPVDDLALVLLCGEPEFKLISEGLFVDRRVRYRVPPRSGVALKYLRSQLGSILGQQFRGKPLAESQILWNDMAMLVLSKTKVPVVEDEPTSRTITWN